MIFSAYALEPLNFEKLLPQTRIVYTAPYSQDFNSVAPGALPEDWSRNDNGYADPLPWQVNHSQACCFFNEYWIGQGRSLWTPWIIIPGSQYRLNFKWSHGQRAGNNYDYGAVYVYVNENNYTKVWERFGTAFNSNDGYTIPEGSIGYPGTGV